MVDTPKSAPSTPTGPHRLTYRIPRNLLIEFLRGNRSLDIPPGAIIAGLWPDQWINPDSFKAEDQVLCVTFEHPSFEEVIWKVPVIDVMERKSPMRVEAGPSRKVAAR